MSKSTYDPIGWDEFMRLELGPLYNVLREKALRPMYPDYEAIIADLKAKL